MKKTMLAMIALMAFVALSAGPALAGGGHGHGHGHGMGMVIDVTAMPPGIRMDIITTIITGDCLRRQDHAG